MTIDIAAPRGSLGPHRSAGLLAAAMVDHGIPARLVERPAPDTPANVHLSNSSRELLLVLARRRDCLVTLHDVMARNPQVRRVLTPLVLRVLRRHRVVVHSRHAAEELRALGFDDPVGTVPLALPVVVPSDEARAAERARLLGERSGPLLVLAGVLKEAKGVAGVVRAMHDAPDGVVVLLGRVADAPTAEALRAAPPGVTVVEGADDTRFCQVLAAADAVLLPRTDSVGETSGPLVMAHALGTPVAMLDRGSAPEYRLPEDLVLDASTPVPDLVAAARGHAWARGTETSEQQVAQVVESYEKEFHGLGWT